MTTLPLRKQLSASLRYLAARERLSVALLSLAAGWAFFYEYLPPFKRAHFPFDIEGFHFPLLDYAFRSLREGRFPLWDPSIYCGVPLAGNIQATLFYPPVWLLFLLNAGHRVLPYSQFEALVAAHIWLAFFLAFLWLRGRFSRMTSLLAAAAYGFSGYVLSQIQHSGIIMGYAWTPLALWGIDQVLERRSWRPLWKVAAASALCLLAGYPSTWVVLCCSVLAYAAATLEWRTMLGAAGALAFSLLLAAVQILPTAEANALKIFDPKYGNGVRSLEFYAAYFAPNYFKLGGRPAGWGQPKGQYLYLGAPALFGLLYLVRARKWRPYLPVVAIGLVCLITLGNPFNWTTELLNHSRLGLQVVRAWNFLEEIPLAASLLAALAIEAFLKRPSRKLSTGALVAGLVLLIGWCARQVYVWLSGADFADRWYGLIEAGVTLALFVFFLHAYRAGEGRRRAWIAVPLLLLVWIDYKVYGTSRGFNSAPGTTDGLYKGDGFGGLDPKVYWTMRAHPEYRLGLDGNAAPASTYLRHWRLTTAQGFDPFLTKAYKKLIEEDIKFESDRVFFLDPTRPRLLDLLAVRYYVSREEGPNYDFLRHSPQFRLLGPADSFYKVYEYLNAKPQYRWESPEMGGEIRPLVWTPEKRHFGVHAERDGRFVLVEEWFPGWRARMDGHRVKIERWREAFQAIPVPAGEHLITFEYAPGSVPVGALISVVSLAGLVVVLSTRSRAGGTGASARQSR